ncbi:MAG: GAF domain-containing protein, partial [Thermostichales cyanobacterium BF4_bins_65]
NSSIRECYHRLLRQYGVKANLVVPIILEANSLWGLLIVHHCTGPYDWDPWMVELLTDLAQQLGIAIQHAQLHQRLELANSALQYQVNIRNAELQSLLDYEKLLRTITEAVRANLNEESILKEAVEAMIEGLDVKDCLVGLLADSNQTTYRIGYAHNPNCLGLIDNLDPLVYEHLLKHQSIYFSTHHLCLGQVTLLIAPMYDQDSLIGFLELIREPGDEFSAAEIRLAEQIANQCAIGIRQARLYQDSLQQVRKLEEINRLKDEFVHMVSHELRTPLTNMNMALKMIEARGVQESQQRYFQILRAEWARELNLVNELLELQALESGTRALVLTSIPVAEVIYKIVEPFIFRTQEHQQYFLVEMQGLQDSMAEWVTDLSLFERIVIELLNNACKYTPSGEKIILRLRQAPEQLIITVINTGVEIPADRQGKIFDKFFRLPNLDHWNQGGTGLGLPLVRKAVELLGGSIKLTSRQRQTQFEVYLPPCQVDQLG